MSTPSWLTPEFIRAIPKTDLHIHLSGSLRLPTLIELAREQQVELPSWTEAGLRELVFKDRYANLQEYLHGFKYTNAVLRTAECLERVAYELVWDNFNEGVRYIEVRFAPQLNARDTLEIEEVIIAVNKGLHRGTQEVNRAAAICDGSEPPFDYGIIGCAMRRFTEGFSPYYKHFIAAHRYSPAMHVYPLASLELVRALVDVRDRLGLPIVGFDLAGEEKGWPADAHKQAYDLAHRHFLKKTVHAGEAFGPQSIFQAITQLHADRLGHATHLFTSELADHIDPSEREKYIEDLVQYIADRRITIEVCLTSNLQTIPTLHDIKQHPLRWMLKADLSLTFCTDNRLVSHTTICKEIRKAVEAFQITPERLKDIIIYGFKRSFSPRTYSAKRAYVHHVIDFYESVESRFAKTAQ